jgi:hypothetical protein
MGLPSGPDGRMRQARNRNPTQMSMRVVGWERGFTRTRHPVHGSQSRPATPHEEAPSPRITEKLSMGHNLDPRRRMGLKPHAPQGEVRAYRADWLSWNEPDKAIHDVNDSVRRESAFSDLNHRSKSTREGSGLRYVEPRVLTRGVVAIGPTVTSFETASRTRGAVSSGKLRRAAYLGVVGVVAVGFASVCWTLARDFCCEWAIAPGCLRDAVDGSLSFGFSHADEGVSFANANAFDVVFVEADVFDQKFLDVRRPHAITSPDTDEDFSVVRTTRRRCR